MNENLKYYLFYTIAYGIILLLGELMYRSLKTGPAWSRNFSHFFAGIISLAYPWLFNNHWWVLGLALQSSLFLLATRHFGFLPSHHKVAKRSLGSVLFFASLYLCFLASRLSGHVEVFILPVLILSFCDVSAAVAGRNSGRWPIIQKRWPGRSGKTLAGSLAFFFTALAILLPAFYYYMDLPFLYSFLVALGIALLSSTIEALSPFGTDNLFVPLSILIFIHLGSIF